MLQAGQTILCWSGQLPDPIATWSKPGWEALLAWLERALPAARELGSRLVLRPHTAHVLSDAQRCIALVQTIDEPTLSVALDPLAILTESMTPDAGDHTRRAVDGALAQGRVGALILPEGETLEGVSPHLERANDTLPPEIPRLIREPWSPPHTPPPTHTHTHTPTHPSPGSHLP